MRVFLTVGAQMPFDRLVRAMDAWAKDRPGHEILAQIGESEYVPSHVKWTKFLSPPEFDRAYDGADAIVGHAGIGTLFAALERGKPIVVMPRRADLRETRNDHQIATARRFEALAGVAVAWDPASLLARLERLDAAKPAFTWNAQARGGLVRRIAEFIDEE